MKGDAGYFQGIGTYTDLSTRRAASNLSIPQSPDRTTSFLGKYVWTSGPLSGFTFGAGGYDQTKIFTGANLTIDFPVTYTMFASYILNKHWIIQANGNNITDERYISNVTTPGLVQEAPRAEWRLSVKYLW